MIINGTSASETLTGGGSDDSIYAAGGNDSLIGLAGYDWLEGEGGNDTLRGGADGDELWGGPGDDLLDGEGGFDLAAFDNAPTGVNVNLTTGTATGEGNDVLVSIEEIVGSLHDDTLTGNSGDNFFDPLWGDNIVDGGAGRDAVLYWWEGADPVTVDLSAGMATFAHGSDVLINIEDVYGTTYDDHITGDEGDNLLDGMEGDDTLDGRGGDDSLYGYHGDDTAIYGGSVTDYVITPGADEDEFIISGPEGQDYLFDIEVLAFDDGEYVLDEGTEAPETLEGGDDDDVIHGRGGDDTVSGGGGDDVLYGDEGDDEIEGDEGDDYLDGGTGDDTMAGGTGNDTYVVDATGDRVIEPDSLLASLPGGPQGQVSVGNGIDRVIASINYTLGNAVENLQLSGSADLAGTGNAMANMLTGNAGHNELSGGAGNDSLDGGSGIDTATYTGTRSQYTFGFTSVNGNGEGTDTLTNMERLDFSDVNVALDVQGSGNGAIVAKILGAVFGQAAVMNETYAGIGIEFADSGMSYAALMSLALGVVLGPSPTNEQVVTLLYTNVVGAAPDPATRDGFVGYITSGAFTQATLAIFAADYMGVPAAAQGGLEYV